MNERQFTCIMCPIGCNLTVRWENVDDIKVSGNNCKRGEMFGIDEIKLPKRMLTTTLLAKSDNKRVLVPVISSDTIPMDKFKEVLKILQKMTINLPIHVGDKIVENILNCGVDINAAKTVE